MLKNRLRQLNYYREIKDLIAQISFGCPGWIRTNTVPAPEAGALPFGYWASPTISIISLLD